MNIMYEKTGVESLFKIYNDLRQSHFILDVFPLKLLESKKKLKANLIQLSIWETLWTDVLRNEQSFIDAFWNWSRNHIDSFSNWKETEVEINFAALCDCYLTFLFLSFLYIHCLRPNIFTFTTKRLKFACSLDLPSYSYLFQVNYKNMTTLSSKTLHLDFFPLYFIVTCI